MKKYRICLFLFLVVSLVCMLIAFLVRRNYAVRDGQNILETAIEEQTASETVVEDQMAANQEAVRAAAESTETYYLVAEDGMLLVFLRDRKTICLYTHVPLMDFPAAERARLREGIWFPSMAEVFNYLESYTS